MKKIIKLSFVLCFVSIQAFASNPTKEDCDNMLIKSNYDKKSIFKTMKSLMRQENIVMDEKRPSNLVLPQYECINNDETERRNQ